VHIAHNIPNVHLLICDKCISSFSIFIKSIVYIKSMCVPKSTMTCTNVLSIVRTHKAELPSIDHKDQFQEQEYIDKLE